MQTENQSSGIDKTEITHTQSLSKAEEKLDETLQNTTQNQNTENINKNFSSQSEIFNQNSKGQQLEVPEHKDTNANVHTSSKEGKAETGIVESKILSNEESAKNQQKSHTINETAQQEAIDRANEQENNHRTITIVGEQENNPKMMVNDTVSDRKEEEKEKIESQTRTEDEGLKNQSLYHTPSQSTQKQAAEKSNQKENKNQMAEIAEKSEDNVKLESERTTSNITDAKKGEIEPKNLEEDKVSKNQTASHKTNQQETSEQISQTENKQTSTTIEKAEDNTNSELKDTNSNINKAEQEAVESKIRTEDEDQKHLPSSHTLHRQQTIEQPSQEITKNQNAETENKSEKKADSESGVVNNLQDSQNQTELPVTNEHKSKLIEKPNVENNQEKSNSAEPIKESSAKLDVDPITQVENKASSLNHSKTQVVDTNTSKGAISNQQQLQSNEQNPEGDVFKNSTQNLQNSTTNKSEQIAEEDKSNFLNKDTGLLKTETYQNVQRSNSKELKSEESKVNNKSLNSSVHLNDQQQQTKEKISTNEQHQQIQEPLAQNESSKVSDNMNDLSQEVKPENIEAKSNEKDTTMITNETNMLENMLKTDTNQLNGDGNQSMTNQEDNLASGVLNTNQENKKAANPKEIDSAQISKANTNAEQIQPLGLDQTLQENSIGPTNHVIQNDLQDFSIHSQPLSQSIDLSHSSQINNQVQIDKAETKLPQLIHEFDNNLDHGDSTLLKSAAQMNNSNKDGFARRSQDSIKNTENAHSTKAHEIDVKTSKENLKDSVTQQNEKPQLVINTDGVSQPGHSTDHQEKASKQDLNHSFNKGINAENLLENNLSPIQKNKNSDTLNNSQIVQDHSFTQQNNFPERIDVANSQETFSALKNNAVEDKSNEFADLNQSHKLLSSIEKSKDEKKSEDNTNDNGINNSNGATPKNNVSSAHNSTQEFQVEKQPNTNVSSKEFRENPLHFSEPQTKLLESADLASLRNSFAPNKNYSVQDSDKLTPSENSRLGGLNPYSSNNLGSESTQQGKKRSIELVLYELPRLRRKRSVTLEFYEHCDNYDLDMRSNLTAYDYQIEAYSPRKQIPLAEDSEEEEAELQNETQRTVAPESRLLVDFKVDQLDPKMVRLAYVYQMSIGDKSSRKHQLLVAKNASQQVITVNSDELLRPNFHKKRYKKKEKLTAAEVVGMTSRRQLLRDESEIGYSMNPGKNSNKKAGVSPSRDNLNLSTLQNYTIKDPHPPMLLKPMKAFQERSTLEVIQRIRKQAHPRTDTNLLGAIQPREPRKINFIELNRKIAPEPKPDEGYSQHNSMHSQREEIEVQKAVPNMKGPRRFASNPRQVHRRDYYTNDTSLNHDLSYYGDYPSMYPTSKRGETPKFTGQYSKQSSQNTPRETPREKSFLIQNLAEERSEFKLPKIHHKDLSLTEQRTPLPKEPFSILNESSRRREENKIAIITKPFQVRRNHNMQSNASLLRQPERKDYRHEPQIPESYYHYHHQQSTVKKKHQAASPSSDTVARGRVQLASLNTKADGDSSRLSNYSNETGRKYHAMNSHSPNSSKPMSYEEWEQSTLSRTNHPKSFK